MNVYFVRYILGRKTRLIGESNWSPAPSSISQSIRGWWRCLVFPEIRSQGCSPAPVFNPLPVTAEYHCFRKDTTWYRKMVINLQRAKKKRERFKYPPRDFSCLCQSCQAAQFSSRHTPNLRLGFPRHQTEPARGDRANSIFVFSAPLCTASPVQAKTASVPVSFSGGHTVYSSFKRRGETGSYGETG